MSATLTGPAFEPAQSLYWRSENDGAHYNVFHCRGTDGMSALRAMFPEGAANDFNFVLFSTSGVHGTYGTIEEAERDIVKQTYAEVTFLIVHPRLVCLRYGNCQPTTAEDIAFLKKLRASSWEAAVKIGKDTRP